MSKEAWLRSYELGRARGMSDGVAVAEATSGLPAWPAPRCRVLVEVPTERGALRLPCQLAEGHIGACDALPGGRGR